MIGQTISHYKIVEKLGEGGMGVVYKAQDTKLDRFVALKFLPSYLSASGQDKARFIQEAKAASALNHPNVCTIYDIQEENGQQFIVMEYVDGVTLREKISVGAQHVEPLRTNNAITYAIQIGDALQEAHSKGIVHRDIKPDNIMINSKNQIKVMDFGLAKLKGSLKLTKTSSTVGTLGYMAPEQIQGGEIDARSDIFSFGVVLFEMLTGHMPFRGEHEAAMMYSILNEEPDSPQKYIPETPVELMHIFGRAFEKDPEDRYQTVHDMVIDLRRLKKESSKVSRASLPAMKGILKEETLVGEAGKTDKTKVRPTTSVTFNIPSIGKRWFIPSLIALGIGVLGIMFYLFFASKGNNGERLPVAVADFVNQTNEPELDGLSGMLITSMEQSRRLAVVTRSRMFDILKQMGKENVDRIDETIGREICQRANVNALITASIRKFGKLYTIDLKVIDPIKNEYLFTAKEEAEGQEKVPGMLDKLSEKVRIGLKENVKEVKKAGQNIAQVTTTNLEAYQNFFQGEQFINHLKFTEAEKEFRKAIELDPTFGLAYYRLAYTLSWQLKPDEVSLPFIEKALALSERIPEKERYQMQALNEKIQGKTIQAINTLKLIESQYPDEKEIIYNIGDWSYHALQYDEAVHYLEKVLAIDPNFDRALEHLTWTYRDQGRFEKMLEVAKRYAAVSGTKEAYGLVAAAYAKVGDIPAGLKALQQVRDLFPDNPAITASLADLYMLRGEYSQALSESNRLITQSPRAAAGYNQLCSVYLYTGQYRKALETLDRMVRLYWEAHDTTNAITKQMEKAVFFQEGLGDARNAWLEVQKTFPYRQRSGSGVYTGWFSILSCFRGDFHVADSLSRQNPISGWVHYIRMLILLEKKDFPQAEIQGDSALALAGYSFVRPFYLFPLVQAQFGNGHSDAAIRTLTDLQKGADESLKRRALYYPKSFYLLGTIYEKKGDTKQAIQNYEKFLDLWKNADLNIPELMNAKTRLAKLKGMTTR